jgi:hypothetical protein
LVDADPDPALYLKTDNDPGAKHSFTFNHVLMNIKVAVFEEEKK